LVQGEEWPQQSLVLLKVVDFAKEAAEMGEQDSAV